MNLSRKKRRWVSLGVGIVGLVTIIGLSDLLFLIPQDQVSPLQEVGDNGLSINPTTTSGEITIPVTIPTSTPTTTPENPNEFQL
ncbi:MAG: hypothetical protein WC099_01205 [Candidatus Paceibacterota bacterium]